jgi:branched-chain amino acid transport system substrate-binding protein
VTDQSKGFLSRRGFLGAAGIAAAGGLAGCSSALKQTSTSASQGAGGSAGGGTIKIGFVSPQTGQLSVFTQSNGYVLGQVRSALAKGLTIGGKKYSVQIIAADSQSSSARAATVASQLVQQSGVDFLIGTATPETVIPVSAQAEASGVPCVLTRRQESMSCTPFPSRPTSSRSGARPTRMASRRRSRLSPRRCCSPARPPRSGRW